MICNVWDSLRGRPSPHDSFRANGARCLVISRPRYGRGGTWRWNRFLFAQAFSDRVVAPFQMGSVQVDKQGCQAVEGEVAEKKEARMKIQQSKTCILHSRSNESSPSTHEVESSLALLLHCAPLWRHDTVW
nr:hypothetical protein CFP56_37181 [Quercus suber]